LAASNAPFDCRYESAQAGFLPQTPATDCEAETQAEQSGTRGRRIAKRQAESNDCANTGAEHRYAIHHDCGSQQIIGCQRYLNVIAFGQIQPATNTGLDLPHATGPGQQTGTAALASSTTRTCGRNLDGNNGARAIAMVNE
jgi:hypothetical protein